MRTYYEIVEIDNEGNETFLHNAASRGEAERIKGRYELEELHKQEDKTYIINTYWEK